ncbi:Adenine nucleotide translocator 1 [Artemisia annua]|uniref:Adenine nucleotide translocator 1 n=1 Tax=Artemisia annua TaxID=35608 RepID=A0A2U1QGK3_ARTAN|nr:Adenine nucleotide translocator 1 [Artemisia annua]
MQGTSTLGIVVVRHRGYTTVVKVDTEVIWDGKQIPQGIDIEDQPEGGANALNVNRLYMQRHFHYGNYSNAMFQYPTQQSADLSMIIPKVSPVCVQAPSDKGLLGFVIDFLTGDVSAFVSKTAAAPIEHVKL